MCVSIITWIVPTAATSMAARMELEAGPMRPHRLVVAISLFLLLAASCGGGGTEDATPTPTCTTVTPGPDGSPTPTPTPCLVGATEAPPTPEPTGELVGEVWEGTVKSIVTGPPGSEASPCGNPIHVQGTAQLVVAEDGSVTGTYDVTGCGVSQPHAEFTGTATDVGFLFPQLVVFTNGSLIPKVSPTQAKATLTNKQGPAVTWVTTWALTCRTCA